MRWNSAREAQNQSPGECKYPYTSQTVDGFGGALCGSGGCCQVGIHKTFDLVLIHEQLLNNFFRITFAAALLLAPIALAVEARFVVQVDRSSAVADILPSVYLNRWRLSTACMYGGTRFGFRGRDVRLWMLLKMQRSRRKRPHYN
jgi:hypothetical protein